MNRDQKAAVVDEIAEQFKSADAVFAVDYRGISVDQAADLRERLREVDSRLRVVKNSLSERAADQAGMESIKPMLTGPTALTFVSGDAAAAAKALNDAARALQLLDFKGGMLGGSLLSGDDVRSIARLPSRDVLIAQLVGTIAAPLIGPGAHAQRARRRARDSAAGDRRSRSRRAASRPRRRGGRLRPLLSEAPAAEAEAPAEPAEARRRGRGGRRILPPADRQAGRRRRPLPRRLAEPEAPPSPSRRRAEAAAEAEPDARQPTASPTPKQLQKPKRQPRRTRPSPTTKEEHNGH